MGLTGRAARGEAAGLLSTRDDFGPGGSASDPLAGLRAGGDSALGADAAADAHASTSLAAQAAHPNQAIEPGQDIDLLQADTARDAGTLRNAQRADVPGLAQALPSGRHGDPGVLARDTAAAGLATPAAGAADTGTAAIESAIASATAQSTDFSARLNAASPAGEPLPSPGAAVLHGQLEPEVGSAQWQQALHQQLLQMRQADARQAELQLNPAGLGPLRIALTMHEQQLHAHFTAAHAQVRAALEAALPQLREALQQGGIQLGQAAVDTGSQPQAGLADPSGSQRRDPDARASRHPSAHLPSAADTASAGPAPAGTTRHGPGQRLNTYA